MLAPPLRALLSHADYDHECPSAAFAPHWAPPFPLELADVILPGLREQIAAVEQACTWAYAHANMCKHMSMTIMQKFKEAKNFADAKRDNIFASQSFAAALMLMIESFFRCSFARPCDENGSILTESPPIYKLFPRNPMFQLTALT